MSAATESVSPASAFRVAVADVGVLDARCEAGVAQLRLDAPAQMVRARAGMFVLLRALTADAPLLPRPLSIVSAWDGVLQVAFNVLGAGTTALAAVRPGDTVQVVGPLGNAFASPARPLTLLTDASHVGGILALARARAREVKPTVLQYVLTPANQTTDAHLLAAFAALKVPTSVCAEEEVEAALASRFAEAPRLAAGARDSVMARAQRVAEARGIVGEASLHAPMACGVGACQVCVRRFRDRHLKLVCEGPVFDLAEPAFDG